MTIKQKLGFEITKAFFNDYNEELKKESEIFTEEFLKVEKEVKKVGKDLIEFERVLENYLETLKTEYFKAGIRMTDLVFNSDVNEVIEEII